MIKVESSAIEIKHIQQQMQHLLPKNIGNYFLQKAFSLSSWGRYCHLVPHFFTIAIVVSLGLDSSVWRRISSHSSVIFIRMPGLPAYGCLWGFYNCSSVICFWHSHWVAVLTLTC